MPSFWFHFLQALACKQQDSAEPICVQNAECEKDHEHLFLHCPVFQRHGQSVVARMPFSWFCGIFLEVDEVRAIRCDYAPNMWFPDFPDRLHPASPVFVDGSTFFSKWAPLRTAAAAVHVADQLDFCHALARQRPNITTSRVVCGCPSSQSHVWKYHSCV